MTPAPKNFPLTLTAALLLLAMPVRAAHAVQDDDLIKLTRALEMLGPVTPEWIMATHPGILTVLDAEKQIYRLEVLRQTGQECSLHSMRNCFYLLKLFASPRSDFDAIYNQMRSQESYKKFMEGLACPLFDILPDVIQKKVALGALPAGSQDMEERITELEYYNGQILERYGESGADVKTREQYNDAKRIESAIPQLEPGFNDPLAVAEAVALMRCVKTKLLFSELAKNSNYSFCIQLNVATIYAHATALLVTKQDGVISFIYANTAGDAFLDNALAAINIVVNFAHNPVRLENAYIRAAYYVRGVQLLWGHEWLKKNSLFKNTYYPTLKKKIEEGFEVDLKSEEYKNSEEARKTIDKYIAEKRKKLEDLDPSKG